MMRKLQRKILRILSLNLKQNMVIQDSLEKKFRILNPYISQFHRNLRLLKNNLKGAMKRKNCWEREIKERSIIRMRILLRSLVNMKEQKMILLEIQTIRMTKNKIIFREHHLNKVLHQHLQGKYQNISS
jgi:hypothetical protein